MLSEIKGVDPNAIISYDAVVIGGPNHMDGPTRGVKKFIDKLSKLSLEGKKFAVFDTYGGGDFEKATKKMEQRVREKAPAMKMITAAKKTTKVVRPAMARVISCPC